MSKKNDKLLTELKTVDNEMEKMWTYLHSLHLSIQKELQTLKPENQYTSEQFHVKTT